MARAVVLPTTTAALAAVAMPAAVSGTGGAMPTENRRRKAYEHGHVTADDAR